MASISTSAPDGSFDTSTRRARGRALADVSSRTPRSSPAKSSKRCRKTVVLTSLSRLLPASSRIAGGSSSTCSVCAAIESPTSSLSPGRSPIWPGDEDEVADPDGLVVGRALKRRRCALRANDLLLCHLASVLSPDAACASAAPSALKIASRTCCESSPSIRRTCSVSPAASASDSRKRAARSECRPPARASREIDVRGDERPAGGLERHLRERLVGGKHGRAVSRRPVHPQQRRERLAELAAGLGDLRLGVRRSELEREVEAARAGEHAEQVVEHRQPRRDGGRAGARDDARAHGSGTA